MTAPITTMSIEPMSHGDAQRAARLHRAALPSGFFPQLGPRFMTAYYRTFADSPHAVALRAAVDGRPAGFLVGTVRTTAHYRWVVRHRGLQLGLLGVASLALRPGAAATFVRTRAGRYLRALRRFARRRPAASPAEPSAEPQLPVAVLTHVAVDPAHRAGGVGRRLVDAFVDLAAAGGAGEAMLVTVDGPAGAGGFWEAQGWRRWGTHANADGRRVARYRLPLRTG